jgi:hypothetical protein
MRIAPCLSALSSLAFLALLAAGCGHSTPVAVVPTPASAATAAAPALADQAPAVDPVSSESAAFTQKPGDYVTYRFSGEFRKTPLLLTERVVDATDVLLVVDLMLDDGVHKTSVRAHYTHAPGAPHELVSVSRLDAAGAEKPMTIAELDTLMARTTLAADDNQGALGSETVTVSVGGHDMACTRTSYHVLVGKHPATMSTLSSDSFPWGDVGGEIMSDQGHVLYRAEVVDLGAATPIVAASR